MSFAAGFFGTLARGMEDKREFIRNRVEEDRRYLREQGLQRQAEVQRQRVAYETAARDLITRGANEQTIIAALEANPQGVLSLQQEVARGGIRNREAINSVIQIANDYQSEATLEEVLQRVVPALNTLPENADPTTVRRTTLASFLGLDTETELNEQVYSAQIVGGMTGDQILASMNIPVQARGTDNPNVAFNFEALESATPMSASEIAQWQELVLNEYELEVVAPRLQTLKERIEQINEGGVTEAEQAELAELMEEKQFLDNLPARRSERIEALIPRYGVLPNTQDAFDRFPQVFDGFSVAVRDLFKPQDSETTGSTPENITVTTLPPAQVVQTEEGTVTPPPNGAPSSEEVKEALDLDPESADLIAANQEEAEKILTEYFEDHPDENFVTINVGGQVVRIRNPRDGWLAERLGPGVITNILNEE